MANFRSSKSFTLILENNHNIKWPMHYPQIPTPLCLHSLLFSACQGILLTSSSVFFSYQEKSVWCVVAAEALLLTGANVSPATKLTLKEKSCPCQPLLRSLESCCPGKWGSGSFGSLLVGSQKDLPGRGENAATVSGQWECSAWAASTTSSLWNKTLTLL